MRFTKMHGLGNDYLYIYSEVPDNAPELSIKLSNRYFGVGSDGIIYISQSSVADFKMRIFNADGSEARMCGNGIRCVGKYVYDKGYTKKERITVETLSGIRVLNLNVSDGIVQSVAVDMGEAISQEKKVFIFDENEVELTPISVGNPHAVIFVKDINNIPITTLGPKLEHDPFFPDGVNVEFVEVIDKNKLRMRVWERGSGITMACGTGACASVAAAIKNGYCEYNTSVLVELDGGILEIIVSDDNIVKMIGPAVAVFEGEII